MFDLTGLQLNRGTYNAQQIGGDATSAIHTYKSATDSMATISAPGYFPDNFNSDPDNVMVGDILAVVANGSDLFGMFEITDLEPVTLVANDGTFPAGITTTTVNATVSITSPIGNLTTVNATTVNATNVTATGTISAPVVNGTTSMTTPTMNATTLNATTITASGNITGAVVTGTTSVVTPLVTTTTINAAGTITGATLAGTTGNITTVNATSVNSTTDTTSNLIVGAGAALTKFDEIVLNVNWDGPWATTQAGTIHLQLINGIAYYTLRGIGSFATAGPGAAISIPVGTIPVAYRPGNDRLIGVFTTFNNGGYTSSSLGVTASGAINIGGTLDPSATFTGPGQAGFFDISFSTLVAA